MLHGLPLCASGKARAVLPGIAGPPKVPLAIARIDDAAGRQGHELPGHGNGIHDLNVGAAAGPVIAVAGIGGDDGIGSDRQCGRCADRRA